MLEAPLSAPRARLSLPPGHPLEMGDVRLFLFTALLIRAQGGSLSVRPDMGTTLDDLLWLGRLGEQVQHAAGLGQRASLGLKVGGGVEDHPRVGDQRVGAQPPHKLEAVDGGHQHIGDHQVGVFAVKCYQRFFGRGCLDHGMADIAK